MGRFINGLQTNYPDQHKLLEDALVFSLSEIREDREDLLRSAKAKKALPREEKDYKPTKFPRLNDVDPEGWVKNLPLPVLILLGHRCSKLRRYQPFETPCKPLAPYEEPCHNSILEDHIAFISGLSSEYIQSVDRIVEVDEELIMPVPSSFRSKFGKEAEEVCLYMVCSCTQALFRNRKTLNDVVWEDTLKSCKILVRRTNNDEKVRTLLGINPDNWKDIHHVFTLAIPVLEAQSLAPIDPQTGASGSFSALMALNHDTLMKDLDRLNDILLVARNCLATVTKAQNLAGESLLDQQVQKLIDLCVRVTARGYDGDTGSRTEIQWGNVIGAYKKLLITCLQFLYNFIQENEQRKLLLWLDLFASSKVANQYAAGALPAGMGRDHFAARLGGTKNHGAEEAKEMPEQGSDLSATDEPVGNTNGTSDTTATANGLTDRAGRHDDNTNPLNSIDHLSISDPEADLSRGVHIQEESEKSGDLASGAALSSEGSINDLSIAHKTEKAQTEHSRETQPNEEFANDTPIADKSTDTQFGAAQTDREDEFGALKTPQSAAITLQTAKDQLMARLADTATGVINDEEQDLMTFPDGGDPNSHGAPLSDDDEGYKSPGEPGDQERGLLTDIPLVLGPQEIEALPMIIQIGICAARDVVMHGRDMQGMRCNILLAGESGRNLLRELLIFIAAWDLQDDEMYFKLMMQIMEAILENGLMPYAYQTFAEVKDIVSPAQSMVIKILTQIFRGKQGLPPTTGKATWTAGNAHADTSRRVDVYVVKYIFTIFRQCIIPETCALIYLQGEIKQKHAMPEDFPLNLWDMERVYEGVYQFLEFFAVLTESEEWKDLLVNWEIVSELVTLLRELEGSIPHADVTTTPLPQTTADAQQAAKQQAQQTQQQPPQPAQPSVDSANPVAVERPFDVNDVAGIPMPTDGPMPAPSPLSQTDSQDQDALDAADPSDFEWRNLKKLVILVLSSLVWKSRTVQDQIRQYGGVEMVVACCTYDGNNPYIREHAVMCLRFLLEGNEENKELVRRLEMGGNPVFPGIRGGGIVRAEDIGERVVNAPLQAAQRTVGS